MAFILMSCSPPKSTVSPWINWKYKSWFRLMLSGIDWPMSIIGNKSGCLMPDCVIGSNLIRFPTAVWTVLALGEFAVFPVCLVSDLGATVGAGVDVAGLAVCGATEPSVLVWDGVSVVVLCTLCWVWTVAGADWVAVAGVLIDWFVTLVGFVGLMGLIGDTTLVTFVTLFTQVFDDVSHEPHNGWP